MFLSSLTLRVTSFFFTRSVQLILEEENVFQIIVYSLHDLKKIVLWVGYSGQRCVILPPEALPQLVVHLRIEILSPGEASRTWKCSLTFTFYGEGLLAPRPTPKLEDHPSSTVRDCLFNLFAAILQIGGLSSIRNLRTRHAVMTGTHLRTTTNITTTATTELLLLLLHVAYCPVRQAVGVLCFLTTVRFKGRSFEAHTLGRRF
jgi:hypothetical protein